MPPKGSKRSFKRAYTRKYSGPKKLNTAARTLQAVVRRAIVQNNRKLIETKRSCFTSPDGTEIFHNNFVTLNPYMLQTTQGTADPTTVNTNNRIGDSIYLQGVQIKMMIELNERYTDVTFRLIVVKCAKNDTPTRATLFNGLSGNKMIDTFNTERYTIIKSKTFKIKAGNSGTYGTAHSLVPADGLNKQATSEVTIQRQTQIIKLWIPGERFKKNKVITYEDNSQQVKFYDYHVLLYAYSNYTTAQDAFYVGRVNDYVQTMYYKDA